jgi:hypothetical protein
MAARVGARDRLAHPKTHNTSRVACLAATAEIPQIPAVTARGSQLTLRAITGSSQRRLINSARDVLSSHLDQLEPRALPTR